jgi:hypothetical protein
MPIEIHDYIWAALNPDPVLAAMWSVPSEAPYWSTAAQGSGNPAGNGGGGTTYAVYQLLQQLTQPTTDNADGPGNTWIFSFQCYSQGTATSSGARAASTMASQILTVLRALVRPIGIQEVLVRSRMESWLQEEKFYRVVLDLQITENLACA